jgi:hypothetical protein
MKHVVNKNQLLKNLNIDINKIREVKMKKLTMTLATCSILFGAFAQAGGHDKQLFMTDQDRVNIKLCKAVKSNNRLHLHLTLKHANISYEEMQKGLVCNGQDPITFAMLNSSEKTASTIASRTHQEERVVLAQN